MWTLFHSKQHTSFCLKAFSINAIMQNGFIIWIETFLKVQGLIWNFWKYGV